MRRPQIPKELFRRFETARQRETRARLLNVMFMRFPLLDPDQFLVRTMPLARAIISPMGAIIWAVVVGFALKLVVENWATLREQSQGVLAPSNLFLLYAGMVLVKAVHEFGHAYFCRRFGGEVHVMGIMLMIFTPMPYVDATSSWGFRKRWQRVLVGAAGMIVELFVAALATMVWARTGPGTLHSLAYNMMFVASVSTVVFNINPLLRYDGYYILSDLVEIPNLYQKSVLQLKHLAERYLFGIRKSESPAHTGKEQAWLTVYGLLSSIYRVVVFSGILLFVADRFLLIGIIMAAVCADFLGHGSHHRLHSLPGRQPEFAAPPHPGGDRQCSRRRRPPPAPECHPLPRTIFARPESCGPANGVRSSMKRLEKSPPSLPRRALTSAAVNRFSNSPINRSPWNWPPPRPGWKRWKRACVRQRHDDTADLKPLLSRRESADKRVRRLERDQAALTVRARQDGTWVAPQIQETVGRWLVRGTSLGVIVDPNGFEFTATVAQEDGDSLFSRRVLGAEARLFGQSQDRLRLGPLQIVPAEQSRLPSPALGWVGGGEVRVARDDPQGVRAAEPFFEVRAPVTAAQGAVLLHGRAGKIRFDLESEPLLPHWLRRLRQLLQKRYQL